MRRKSSFQSFISGNRRVIVPLLILAGVLIRVLYLGENPVGLNQDEASAGYEAWSLLNYGIDRNGDSLPVLFTSWGSGQNVLYSYLSIPFVALFGLNTFSIRLVSALFGSLSLPVFYLLAKKLRGDSFAVAALFFLVINPWHIMLSRWALESNLLPFFLLLGIYFLTLSSERPRFLIPSAVSFALCLYAYGTAFIFLPLFFIMCFIYLVVKRELRLKYFICSALVFAAISLPIVLCNIINILGWDEINVFGVTLPVLTETRQSATTVIGGSFKDALDNFISFAKLLFTQSDGLLWNALPGFGLYYFFGLFAAVIGLLGAGYETIKNRSGREAIVFFALLASLAASFFIDVNINRMNMAFLPVIYFSALGFYFILCKLKRLALPLIAGALICFTMFMTTYFSGFRDDLSEMFFEGLGEAVVYAETLDYDEVYITDYVNSPYIFVLFYNQIPPEEFYGSVEYSNPETAFRAVTAFSKYRFGSDFTGDNTVFIVHRSQISGLDVIAYFGNYAVCV